MDETTMSADACAKLEKLRATYAAPADGIQLQGLNHLALVCEDMERTCEFYSGTLGLPLTKTIALDDGSQHFFFDIGNGESLAFFWFKDGVRRRPGVSSVDPAEMVASGTFATAHGSMNHVAFSVAEGQLKQSRRKLRKAGVEVRDPTPPSRPQHTNHAGAWR